MPYIPPISYLPLTARPGVSLTIGLDEMGGVIFLAPRRIGYPHLLISGNIIEDTGRGNT